MHSTKRIVSLPYKRSESMNLPDRGRSSQETWKWWWNIYDRLFSSRKPRPWLVITKRKWVLQLKSKQDCCTNFLSDVLTPLHCTAGIVCQSTTFRGILCFVIFRAQSSTFTCAISATADGAYWDRIADGRCNDKSEANRREFDAFYFAFAHPLPISFTGYFPWT